MSGLFRYLLDAIGLGSAGAAQAFRKEGGLLTFRYLQDESVRQELGLSIEQIGMIGKYTREAREKQRNRRARLPALEMDKRREEVSKIKFAVAEDAVRAINKAGILTEQQRQRLRQIMWQNRGADVFTDPNAVKALGFSEGQQHAILNILEDAGKKRKEMLKGEESEDADPDGEAKPRSAQPTEEEMEKLKLFRKGILEKALTVLTEEQRKTWEELKGSPFEVNLDGPATSRRDERG